MALFHLRMSSQIIQMFSHVYTVNMKGATMLKSLKSLSIDEVQLKIVIAKTKIIKLYTVKR